MIHNAIITASSAEVFYVGIPDIALNLSTKTTPRFYSNAKQAYKLREEEIRKTFQHMAETSILTNICNY